MASISINKEAFGNLRNYDSNTDSDFAKIHAIFSTETNIAAGYIYIRHISASTEDELKPDEIAKLEAHEYVKTQVDGEDGKKITKYYARDVVDMSISPDMRVFAKTRVFDPSQFTPTTADITFSIDAGITIPPKGSLKAYIKMFTYLPKSPAYRTIVSNKDPTYCLIGYLFPMMAIDGMLDAYDLYTEFPDEGVSAPPASEAEVANMYRTILAAQSITTQTVDDTLSTVAKKDSAMTKADWLALAYTHIYSWCKSRSTSTANFDAALKKRLSTLRSVMGWRYFSEDTFMQQRVDSEALADSCKFFAFFPTLKAMFLSNLLNVKNPFAQHLKLILKESQITVFNMIYTFLYDSDLTVLHFNKEVTPEIKTYLEVLTSVQKSYGNNWHYMKLISPNEQQTAVNQFPKLADAARAYVLANAPQVKTMKNIVGMNSVPISYIRQARVKIDKSYYSDDPVIDLNAAIDIYNSRLSKNIDKNKLTKEHMTKLLADVNLVSLEPELTDLFKRNTAQV